VRRGETVATLEPLRSQALDPRSRAEAEAAVLAAQAGLAAAMEKAKAATADAEYIEKRAARIANLFAKGSVAKDQFDQTQAEVKKARSLQDGAKAAVDGARADLERIKSTLRSFPAAGREGGHGIVHVSSPVGGVVFGVGEPLMDVGNVKNLEVRVEVLSADAVKIVKGTPVLFKRWGGEGTLTGVVRIVEPAGFTKVSSLGVEEQRVLVIADITAPPERWRVFGDGYRLEAHFVIWEGKDVLQIPAGALVRSGKEGAVFVAENGRARLRKAEIGQRNGLTAEILSGLKEKEQVIAHPDDAVSDGAQIRGRK
jgi:HlyD family secretion protein